MMRSQSNLINSHLNGGRRRRAQRDWSEKRDEELKKIAKSTKLRLARRVGLRDLVLEDLSLQIPAIISDIKSS